MRAIIAGRPLAPSDTTAIGSLRRMVAVVIWLTTMSLASVTFWLVLRNGVGLAAFFGQFTAAMLLSSMTTVTVGVLILVRRPGNAVGWWMCTGLLTALAAAVGQYARYGMLIVPSAPAAEVAAWLNLWLWIPSLLALVVFIPLLFPDGHPPSPRWRAVGWLGGVAGAVGVVHRAVSPAADPGLPRVANPYGINGIDALLGVLEAVWVASLMLAVAGAVASLLVRFRRAAGRKRQQLKWVFYAATLLVMAEVVTPLVGVALLGRADPTLVAVAEAVATPWVPIAVGVAILRHRLYDIDALISRSMLYGLLTASVIAMYVLVVGYFGAALNVHGEPASLLAAAIIAVVFAPLRTRLQRLVNRWVYGQRDEPYAVLAALGRRLEASLEPHAVLPTIITTVREALKLPHAEIVLADAEHRVSSGVPAAAPLGLPLLVGTQVVGELRVSPRGADESFTAADHELLSDFARQAAVAAHAVTLSSELRRAHTRLVNTREEERRRLRRDLHDGLGPQLASQTLALDAARRLVTSDPAAAERLLVDLREQTQTAVGEIRRLVYGLRPPVLDDRGLAAALREELARFQRDGLRLEITCPQDLPVLPAAVDLALYRIALEAVTNVIRHARATQCEVSLCLEPGSIVLRIRDDGGGIPPDAVPGVGFRSMQERARELGGTVGFASDSHTTVKACLPLPENG